MESAGWALTQPPPRDTSLRPYPRINRFDLDEAVKYNFIQSVECASLIKDPNKHHLLFLPLDLDCPSNRAILQRQNKKDSDVTFLSYQHYLRSHHLPPELEARIANDQYLLRLHRLIGFLKHVTARFYALKEFYKEKEMLGQRNMMQQCQDQQTGNKANQLSLKHLEVHRPVQLKEVCSADKKKFQFQLDNHHRFVEICK